jgi:hypothetical protein
MTMCHRGLSGPECGSSGPHAGKKSLLSQGCRPSGLEPRTVCATVASTVRRPGDPSWIAAMSTSQSRTQGIAHHEKTLEFVAVWSQIGDDHHRGGVPPSG